MSFISNSLILLTAIYILGILYIRVSNVELPEWMSITAGVLILIKTRKGIPQIKQISNSSNRWDSWGNMGILFALFVMGSVFIFTLYSLFVLLTTQADPSITDPKNYLVIPGVNDFIPLTVLAEVVIALLFAMVIHELGHAIYCVYEDIGIESTGVVLLGIIPIGAFVEPNEEGQEKASKISRLRMFSAGVFNNFWTTIITLVLLIVISSTVIAPVGGAYIANSENPDLERGDVIQNVNGVDVNSNSEFLSTLEKSEGETAQLTLANGESITLDKEIFVSSVIEGKGLKSGAKISQINNQEISSIAQMKENIYSSSDNELLITTENGENITYKTGSSYILRDSISVSSTTIPRNSLIRVVSYNDSVIHSSEQIDSLSKGDTISFEFEDTIYTQTISEELQSNTVSVEGINGLEFKQLNASLFEAQLFYNLVSGDGIESIGVILWFALLFFAPFASLIGLDNNFPGFTTDISNFYSVTESSFSIFEPGVMFILTVLYWSFWLNCNLFIFNCLPTYALDGGHILRDSVQIVGEKLGLEPETANVAITGVLVTTVVSLVLMIGYSVTV